jgi:hypothetical protein
MDEGQTAKPTAKSLIILVLAVIVAAVVITLIQSLILGKPMVPLPVPGGRDTRCLLRYFNKKEELNVWRSQLRLPTV